MIYKFIYIYIYNKKNKNKKIKIETSNAVIIGATSDGAGENGVWVREAKWVPQKRNQREADTDGGGSAAVEAQNDVGPMSVLTQIFLPRTSFPVTLHCPTRISPLSLCF